MMELKDIYISNGIYHNLTDQDFIDFFANEVMQRMESNGKKEEVSKIIDRMSSVPIANKLFMGKGNLGFEELDTKLEKSFSNGAAYGDLDNDGDLDLVVNNVNQKAFVYENHSKNNYLKIQLKGSGKNTFAIGAKVFLHRKDTIQFLELVPSRGFQSSVDYSLIFGLGIGQIGRFHCSSLANGKAVGSC